MPPFFRQRFGDHIAALVQSLQRFRLPVVRGILNIAQLVRGQPLTNTGFLFAALLVAGPLYGKEKVNRRDGNQTKAFAVAPDRGDVLLCLQ